MRPLSNGIWSIRNKDNPNSEQRTLYMYLGAMLQPTIGASLGCEYSLWQEILHEKKKAVEITRERLYTNMHTSYEWNIYYIEMKY